MLSGIPKHKRVWCAIWRKHVLDKLHSGMSSTGIGHEFSVNGSAVCIKEGVSNRNTHKTRLYVHQLMQML